MILIDFIKLAFWGLLGWFKPSFEGKDGKASYRRLTGFFLAFLNAYLIFSDKIPPEHRIYIYYANLTAVCLIIGIVTTQNILDFFHRSKSKKEEEEPQNQDNYGIDEQGQQYQ